MRYDQYMNTLLQYTEELQVRYEQGYITEDKAEFCTAKLRQWAIHARANAERKLR